MIPKPAQYLLRFDDLCPTVSRDHWQRFLPIIAEFGIQPILAVVPDNQDPELELSAPDPDFWAGMRALEAAGAAIALHGYRHICASKGGGLLPFHSQTEFAGVPEDTQRQWIRAGLGLLRGHGLNPTIWVAPRHGFDLGTLSALTAEGIETLSDGLARRPFKRGGLIWIPQQLWAPVEKSSGVWTICVHSNTATDAQISTLRAFLRRHSAQFISVASVLAESQPTALSPAERLSEALALGRIQASHIKKRLARRPTLANGNPVQSGPLQP
jgi:predicted deacetylase